MCLYVCVYICINSCMYAYSYVSMCVINAKMDGHNHIDIYYHI